MGRFSVLPATPPPPVHLGLQAPQPCNLFFSRTLQPPATISWEFRPGPTDIAPVWGDFRFCLPNRPPLCISGFRPPRLATCSSPAPYNPLLPLAGGFDQVLPISHLYGGIFSFACQTAPPCASWASGPPALQPVPLSHPTTPC